MQLDRLKAGKSRSSRKTKRTLSEKEEHSLAEAIAKGDMVARDRMIVANLGLAVEMAQRWKGRGLDADDLVSEATCGLIRAVDQFDPGRGVRFCTFASYWIKQSLWRAVEDSGTLIPLSAHTWGLVRQWKRAAGKLAGDIGRKPTSSEIAESLGFSSSQARRVVTAITTGVKLASTIAANGSRLSPLETYRNEDVPTSEVDILEDFAVLRKRFQCLDDRERMVLSLRYGLDGNAPQSLARISDIFGTSRHFVKLIQLNAERKLRASGPIPARAGSEQRPVNGGKGSGTSAQDESD